MDHLGVDPVRPPRRGCSVVLYASKNQRQGAAKALVIRSGPARWPTAVRLSVFADVRSGGSDERSTGQSALSGRCGSCVRVDSWRLMRGGGRVGSRDEAGGFEDAGGGLLCCFVGDLRKDGGVGVGGEHDAGVPEHLLHTLQFHRGRQGEGGCAVAQVVQPDRRQPCLAISLLKVRVSRSGAIGSPLSPVKTYPLSR